jgi:hypothetical protein
MRARQLISAQEYDKLTLHCQSIFVTYQAPAWDTSSVCVGPDCSMTPPSSTSNKLAFPLAAWEIPSDPERLSAFLSPHDWAQTSF